MMAGKKQALQKATFVLLKQAIYGLEDAWLASSPALPLPLSG